MGCNYWRVVLIHNSMTVLRPHQQAFKDSPFRQCILLYHCMRSGKTISATLYVQKYCDESRTLVVCPKHLVSMWKESLPKAKVFSKEQIKKQSVADLGGPGGLDCIILDESHLMSGALHDNKKRSAIADHIYDIIAANQSSKRLLLTGTPATNSFHAVHTQLYFLGVDIGWEKYRSFVQELIPMPYFILRKYNAIREARGQKPMKRMFTWENRADWRSRVDRVLAFYTRRGIIDRVKPEDIAKDLPPEDHVMVEVKGDKHTCPDGEICHWTHHHIAEQENKVKWILNNPFDKVIIVAYYRDVIDQMYDELSKYRTCYRVYGGMNDKDEVIKKWQNDPYGYLIVSSKCGEGWSGHSADCMIFVNISHEYVAYSQMKDRLTTYEQSAMKQKLYYHLLGGAWDKKIHDTVVTEKQDFRI